MAQTDTIEIPIGDQKITLPAWSTETTLSVVADYSKVTAKSLNAMLKTMGVNSKVGKANKKIFDNILSAQKNTLEVNKDSDEAAKKSAKRLHSIIGTNAELARGAKGFAEAFIKSDLDAMTKAIAGVGMVGAVAGVAMGTIVQFSKELVELSNVGVGFGDTLLNLRGQATQTGLDLGAYGKIVSSNLTSMMALGDTVGDGAKAFSALSETVFNNVSAFNNFGLSNTELNQTIADEIELRRKAGMDQSLIAGSVASSMKGLQLETSALAMITGRDKREVMRARQEQASDAAISSFIGTLDDGAAENVRSISEVLSVLGEGGTQFAKALVYSADTGLDFRTVMGGAMAELSALSPEMGKVMADIDTHVKNNFKKMDKVDFEAILTTKVAGFQNALTDSQRKQLALYATTTGAGQDAARSLLEFSVAANGISTDLDKNKNVYATVGEDIAKTTLLALSSSLETTVNTLRDATLNSVIGIFDSISAKLGGDGDAVRTAGDGMVGTLKAITTAFTDEGLDGGAGKLFDQLDATSQNLALLTIAAGTAKLALDGVGGTGGAGIGFAASAALMSTNVATALKTTAKVAAKWVTPVAILTSVIRGIRSEELKDSGMNVGERVSTQIESDALSFLDTLANASGNLVDLVTGRDDFGNSNLGEKWKDHRIRVEKWEQDMHNRPPSPPVKSTIVAPKDMTAGKINTSYMTGSQPNNNPTSNPDTTLNNQSGSIDTGMTKDNAWRHGDKGEKFLATQTMEIKETNRLIRQLIVEYQNN